MDNAKSPVSVNQAVEIASDEAQQRTLADWNELNQGQLSFDVKQGYEHGWDCGVLWERARWERAAQADQQQRIETLERVLRSVESILKVADRDPHSADAVRAIGIAEARMCIRDRAALSQAAPEGGA